MSNIKINDVFQRIQYAATNGQTQFTIPFPFFQNSYVYVWQDGVQIFPGGGAGEYAITGAGSPSGGLITLVTPATLDSIITIQGIMPIDRTSIYSATISNLTGSDLNGDFNREVVMMKQIETTQALLQLQYAPWSLISQDPDVTIDRYIPLLGPQQIWRMNNDGDAIEAFTLSGSLAPSIGPYIIYTADGSLSNAQNIGALTTGLLKNTVVAGSATLSTAVSGSDYWAPGNALTRTQAPVVGSDVVNKTYADALFGAGVASITGTTDQVIASAPTGAVTLSLPQSIATTSSPTFAGLTLTTPLSVANGGTGATTASGARTNLGLGTMATQNANNVAVTGGTLSGVAITSSTAALNSGSVTATPTANTDLVNKAYVDSIASGFHFVNPVNAASTANFTSTYSNGASGVGATLTATSNGAFSLDGQAGVLNNRYLMKDQSTTFQNGIYTLTQVGTAGTPAILTRATDFDQPSEIQPGDLVTVLEGTTNGGTLWLQTATVTTVGTSPILFTAFSPAFSNVVTITGTQTVTGAKTFSAATSFTDQITVDNININGNTISSTDANGNILLTPNGTGMVGIGGAPSSKLDVRSDSSGAAVTILRIKNSSAAANTEVQFALQPNTASTRAALITSTQTSLGNIADLKFYVTNASDPVLAMTIAVSRAITMTNGLTVSGGSLTLGATQAVNSILTDTTMAAAANTNMYTGLAIKTYVDTLVSPWVAYTPTFTGFGTVSGVEIWSRRVGGTLQVRGRFTSGTSTATEARMTLGFNGTNSNVTSSSSKITSIQIAGPATLSVAAAASFFTLIESNTGYITFGFNNAGTAGLTKQNGSALIASGNVFSFIADIPVDTWP